MRQQKLLLRIIIALVLICGNYYANAQGQSVNTTGANPDASAILDVSSTTQGMLIPRMTSAQIGLIGTPATGLLVYQTDAPAGFYFYTGSAWISLSTTTGTVNSVSVNSSNGLGGTSSGGANPALTLTTSVNGMVKGNGTALSAATAGTDYQAAGNYITALTSDVSASGPGSATATIQPHAVNYSKMQSTTAGSVLLGNSTGSAGNVQEITLGTGLGFSSGQLVNTAGTSFATPAANSVTISAPTAGSATTAMRSDATLQLSQAITPTWAGLHTFTGGITSTGTSTLSFGNDASAQTIHLGDGGAVKAITVGSTNTTSGTTVQSGSTGVNINAGNNQPTNINTGTSTGQVNIGGTGAMTIDIANGGTGAKTVNIGDGASTGTTTIISGTGGMNISTDGNAEAVNIGTGAAAKTVKVGSTNATSSTAIQSGSGGVNINTTAASTATGATNIGNATGGTFLPQFNTATATTGVLTMNNNTGQIGATTAGVLIGVKVITSGTSYTPDAGTNAIYIILVGGGGAGGGNTAATFKAGGGGGAGGVGYKYITGVGTGPYTVAIGGAGGGVSAGTGGGGGNTTFTFGATTYTANGGSGGPVSPTATGTAEVMCSGGAGGAVSVNCDLNGGGTPGGNGWQDSFTYGSDVGGPGGSGPYGGGGVSPVTNQNVAGNSATGFGAGGSGAESFTTATAHAGGNGSAGVLIIYEYR